MIVNDEKKTNSETRNEPKDEKIEIKQQQKKTKRRWRKKNDTQYRYAPEYKFAHHY